MCDSWILTEMPCMAHTPGIRREGVMRKYVPSAYMVDVETDEPEFTGLCEYVRAEEPLVAAAPELLAALKRRAERRDAFDDDEWEAVRRLIDRAEGRTE